uniref:TF_AP-2 domain-containing protein n=1 Tax=Rhabditophanes sp. KR3021 TaxID=114890 RepID=A0AC35U791_9BILA
MPVAKKIKLEGGNDQENASLVLQTLQKAVTSCMSQENRAINATWMNELVNNDQNMINTSALNDIIVSGDREMNEYLMTMQNSSNIFVDSTNVDVDALVGSLFQKPLNSASNIDSKVLPKECDKLNRKRPAAIQELLQLQKRRKNNNGSTTSSTPTLPTEDDTETSGSGGSRSSSLGTDSLLPLISNNNSAKIKKESFDASVSWMNALFRNNQGSDNVIRQQQSGGVNLDMLKVTGIDQGVTEYMSLSAPVEQTFAQVPGRLSLLSNVVKYKMSVGEIRRRILGPESFNFSLLGALLRRAKMPEKSQALVTELADVGLSIARGRRRLSQVNLMSAMTEAESVAMANDFSNVTKDNFPVKLLADDCVKKHTLSSAVGDVDENAKNERVQKLKNAMDVLQELINYMLADRSPILDKNPEPVLESHLQAPLSQYSMLTHCFGVPSLLVGVDMAMTFMSKQLETYEQNK